MNCDTRLNTKIENVLMTGASALGPDKLMQMVQLFEYKRGSNYISTTTQLGLHSRNTLCNVGSWHSSISHTDRKTKIKMKKFALDFHLNLCFHLCLLPRFVFVSPPRQLFFTFFTSTADLLFAHLTVNETRKKRKI